MNIVLQIVSAVFWVIVWICAVAILVYLVRKIFILSRRGKRRGELRRHIDMIRDPSGCSDAIRRYEACKHIMVHYSLPLQEVEFDGNLDDLWTEVGKSLSRFEGRAKLYPI